MSERLTYRLFEERDLPSLLALWEEAGWGSLTERQWREWYLETPFGAALVTVAVDGAGKVAAQEMFMPSLLKVNGREVRALRFSAPILRTELRGRSLRRDEHPMIGLYKAAAEAASQRGFGVVYSMPEYAWLPIFRLAPRFGVPSFAETSYGCASLRFESALGGDSAAGVDEVTARPVAEFGDEYEELWLSAKESFPIECGVVRGREWLKFRNSGRIAVEVRERASGKLVGYTATKRQTGLLADLLARTCADLPRVLAATLRWLASERGAGRVPENLAHLKVMLTPALAAAVEAFDSEPVDYRFAFTCNTFDADALPLEALAPERWYLMPGD
ncbi:MAG TPA: hypothetical protein VGB73_19865 [Pyrinomonadaceae bacterium]|jgi:hypothetical protein